MNRIAKRTFVALLLSAFLLAGLVFFLCEFIFESDEWTLHAGSPHVYDGTNIGCGAITDRDGILILDANGGRTYSTDPNIRCATVHWVGDRSDMIDAPAVSTYSSYLAGYDLFNGVYHYGNSGGRATLTLSASVQAAALLAMGEHKGTVAVYNYKTGEILCAVTTPTFDPEAPPQITEGNAYLYDGIYYNRFTQSAYTPGSIFKIVTLAAALEEIPQVKDMTFTCTGAITFGPDEITCERTHGRQNLQSAFRNSCNCAFAQVAEMLGPQKLRMYVDKFGVTESIQFDGITTAAGNFDVADAMDAAVAWSSIGQHRDQVNPCTFMTFMGAIANGGEGVLPHLVQSAQVGKTVTYQAETVTAQRIVSAETAATVQEYLRSTVRDYYGDSYFPGLSVCAKTGTGEVGGDKKPNAMLTGFVSDESYPLAFIVCIEDGGYGKTVCLPIASSVLSACKTVIDAA